MTSPVKYSQVLLKLDPAGGTSYAHPCLFNTEKSIDITPTFSEDIVPDCDDPDAPAEVHRNIDNVDLTLSGAGKVHVTDVKTYVDLAATGTKIPAKICVGAIDVSGSIEISTTVVITGFSITAPRPQLSDCTISLAADAFKASDVAAYVTPE